MTRRCVWSVKIDDVQTLASEFFSKVVPSYGLRDTYEARTTSRPQGEIDMDPTGLSTSNDTSLPKVELKKAELTS